MYNLQLPHNKVARRIDVVKLLGIKWHQFVWNDVHVC